MPRQLPPSRLPPLLPLPLLFSTNLLSTLTPTTLLGLSWTTYGYLATHLLSPLTPSEAASAESSTKQNLLQQQNHPRTSPFCPLWTSRHTWFPLLIQILGMAAHAKMMYDTSRGRRRFPRGWEHLYLFAIISGKLVGVVVAGKVVGWVAEGGLREVAKVLVGYGPGVVKKMKAMGGRVGKWWAKQRGFGMCGCSGDGVARRGAGASRSGGMGGGSKRTGRSEQRPCRSYSDVGLNASAEEDEVIGLQEFLASAQDFDEDFEAEHIDNGRMVGIISLASHF